MACISSGFAVVSSWFKLEKSKKGREKLSRIRWMMKPTKLYYCLSRESLTSRWINGHGYRAVVRFWRRRDLFALGPEESPTLYFNGKKAVKTSDVSRIVGKTFKETKSGGYKKLKHRAADSYAGLTERQIRHVTSNNVKYRIYNAVFKNKVLPKPVRAKHVHSQHQTDLIDLTKQLNSSSLLVRLSAMSSLRWTCLVVIFGSHHWKRSQVVALQGICKRYMKNMDHQIVWPLKWTGIRGESFLQ